MALRCDMRRVCKTSFSLTVSHEQKDDPRSDLACTTHLIGSLVSVSMVLVGVGGTSLGRSPLVSPLWYSVQVLVECFDNQACRRVYC